MKVLFVVVAIWATANVIVPCNAGGHHDDSWWWRAMDGTPILMDRLTNRKKSVDHHSVVHSKWGNESEDVSAHGRFLAFGDYVDPTFSCPATITCPDICVASTDDCPADAVCPETFELCPDGTCADITAGETCDPEAESPCTCNTLSIICAKQVDLEPVCSERFTFQYDAYMTCLEEQLDSLPQVDFTGPWFLACYASLPLLTFLMLIWCAWNQRWAPISGSKMPLEPAKFIGDKKQEAPPSHEARSSQGALRRMEAASFSSSHHDVYTMKEGPLTQTGYKTTIIGLVLYYLIVLAHVIIQFLLFALTVEYYVQQEAIVWSIFGSQVFFDDVQVLMAFEIVWMVGFVWCFFLKFPGSIYHLFLRRCRPADAHYIAVTAPIDMFDVSMKTSANIASLTGFFTKVISFLFSNNSQRGEGSATSVTFCKVRVDSKMGTRHFYFRFRRFIYDAALKTYVTGSCDVQKGMLIGEWLDSSYMRQGLSQDEAVKRLGIVGPNVLKLKKPTFIRSMYTEFSKPFYLYQTFMVWTWAPFWYYYMAIVNTCIRLTGGIVVAVFQFMSDRHLYQLMAMKGSVEVIRGGETIIMDQTEVVPGDIVRLLPGHVYFDMVILQASKVIVDESALTGEIHPIAKMPLDPASSQQAYNLTKNKTSTLFAGTTILDCGTGSRTESDLAVVTKTGSFTVKGQLLSDILSYERHKFKFDDEVKIVLAILVAEAIVMVALVAFFLQNNWVYNWLYAMFVVGTVLPPLLPTVFVVSVGISCKRLLDKKITCMNAQGILVAGKVKKAVFDKTGTLTKQGMEFIPVDVAGNDSFLMRGIASCQTLHLSSDGNLIGPTVDRIGFEACSAKMVDENTVSFDGETITYLKRFDFDFFRMTQSVIVKHGEEAIVYVKGSPESISRLCLPSSLPSDFAKRIRQSARDGIYQMVIATKAYSSVKGMQEVTRDDIEKDLEFLGFINFQNPLKEESPAVIKDLLGGNVDCVMITGDNVLTGVKIALAAGIIEPNRRVVIGDSIRDDGQIDWLNYIDDTSAFPSEDTSIALTGKVWEYLLDHDPRSALEYAKRTKVFGRCTPDDKVSIVSTFVEMGDITLMCGDGSNDCGALKAAHVGIALSDAEASVVAPFTSLDKNITSVTDIVREGRCALASAIACYKYMLMYGQVESINQVVNAYFSVTFSEWCWVFMDGIWVSCMSFTLPLAKAAKYLSKLRPTASILGPNTMWSACGTLAINFVFLVIALAALFAQDWFQCRKWGSNDVSTVTVIGDNYESSVIFIVSGYQYISSAAAFNFGYSFRQNWFRNYVFVLLFLLFTAMQFGMTLSAGNFSCIWRVNCDNAHVVRFVTDPDPKGIYNIYSTTVMPVAFRWLLVGLMVANLVVICAWNYFLVNKVRIGRKGVENTNEDTPLTEGQLQEKQISCGDSFNDEKI